MTAAVAAVAVSAPVASASGRAIVRLSAPVSSLLAAGEHVKIRGRVLDSPRRSQMALEASSSGTGWHVVARAPVRGGRFSLSWLPPAGRRTTVRLSLRHAGRLLARSSPVGVSVGPPPQLCPEAHAPANLPAGDGWVVGGLYDEGGPAPGIFDCVSGPYEIVAIDDAGNQQGSVKVGGLESYVLVLPPGSYELHNAEDNCFSEEVTVVAGMAVKANTVCQIP